MQMKRDISNLVRAGPSNRLEADVLCIVAAEEGRSTDPPTIIRYINLGMNEVSLHRFFDGLWLPYNIKYSSVSNCIAAGFD